MSSQHETESEFLHHEACPSPDCGSSDAFGRYSDGHGHCFSCGHYEPGDGTGQEKRRERRKQMVKAGLILDIDVRPLKGRNLSLETCEKFGYGIGTYYNPKDTEYHGQRCQIAPCPAPDGSPAAQKLRFKDKGFRFVGDTKKAGLYGQHLWRDGGRMVVVTEGEIDAMSVSQLQGNKWPVVSVLNGAQGARKNLSKQVEWLNKFDTIILMMDMDEPGQEVIPELAALFRPGKVKVASLPLKDANDMLVAGRGAEVIDAIWGAKEYRPDGIVSGEDIELEDVFTAIPKGFMTPYPLLNKKMHGIRKGELTLFTAGSGIGKSTIVREIAYEFCKAHGLRMGNLFLEENYRKTVQGYIAIDNNVALGNLREDPNIITPEQKQASFDGLINNGRNFFYNHFGSLESDELIGKLNYLAVACECDFIYLDHISMVVSGQEGSGQGERKDIDVLMTKLRSLIEMTGVGVIGVVHLNQPDGTPHEEGGRVTLRHLRGSGSLKQLSDSVIALERDQQGDNPNETRIRILKCREFGELGEADLLSYNHDTGRLLPVVTQSPFGDEPAGDNDDPFS